VSARVGVEVEFAGLSLEAASRTLARGLKTSPRVVSEHQHEFDTAQGVYRLEVDFELLTRLSRERREDDDPDLLRDIAVGALSLASKVATPLELVTPPLPRDALHELQTLVDSLAAEGAKGTSESIVYAFGVHFNPEAELRVASIVAHLQAFLCLHDWLMERDRTDLTRRLTAFALPFPDPYARLVLGMNDAPDQASLIDGYLLHNASRNRALDMLPLFAHLDADRVAAVIDDRRVNARPTYHYRLPNCRLGEPGWSLLAPWRDWLEVEKLASDGTRLAALCERRLAHLEVNVLIRNTEDWVAQCQRDINAH
jgi:hypothetical protein